MSNTLNFWQIIAYEANSIKPINFGIASSIDSALEQRNRLARHGLFERIEVLKLNSVKN